MVKPAIAWTHGTPVQKSWNTAVWFAHAVSAWLSWKPYSSAN